MSFPFHDLPLLIQWKILREYVPDLFKAMILARIPDFEGVLTDKESWLQTRPECFEFFEVARRLKPGLYFRNYKGWVSGFYVKVNDNVLTMTYISFDKPKESLPFFMPVPFVDSLLSWSEMIQFLTEFLDKYDFYEDDAIKMIYSDYLRSHFIVNIIDKSMYWIDGKVYPLKNNESYKISEIDCDIPLIEHKEGSFEVDVCPRRFAMSRNDIQKAFITKISSLTKEFPNSPIKIEIELREKQKIPEKFNMMGKKIPISIKGEYKRFKAFFNCFKEWQDIFLRRYEISAKDFFINCYTINDR